LGPPHLHAGREPRRLLHPGRHPRLAGGSVVLQPLLPAAGRRALQLRSAPHLTRWDHWGPVSQQGRRPVELERRRRVRPPGFEVNDLGFQERVDRISVAVAGRRRWSRPGKTFQHAVVEVSHGRGWNYDGDPIQGKVRVYAFGQFRNFWIAEVATTYSGGAIGDAFARAGRPPGPRLPTPTPTTERR